MIACLAGLVAVCNGEVKNPRPREKSEAFTFIVMGDNRPHNKADKFIQPPQFYRNIKEINLLDPDFVVITGDLIMGYTDDRKQLKKMWDNFDQAVAKFTVPYYQVIGNHDVANQVMQDVYLKRYGKRFPLYYSFNHKGCHFIMLNTDLHGEYNKIINRQLAWLKKDLEANKGARKLFVFMHKPLFKYDRKKSNWTAQVHPLMARYGVDTVFCAHWHHYTKYKTLDGVRYIISGGAGAELGNRPEIRGGFYHYCPVTVRGDKVSISVIKTGCVMNENVVNESTAGKVRDLARNLTTLRLKKGTKSLPKQMNLIVSNPFDKPITGTLFFNLPNGSPWKIPSRFAIAIKAGSRQKIPLTLPPGGTVDNLAPLKPFPKISWRLKMGNLGYTRPRHRSLPLRIDRWPYAANLEKLRRKGVIMQPIASGY